METIIASAPGSLMLMGEHAVLHDQPAIVASVKSRITVKLTPLATPHVLLESDRMGHHSAKLNELEMVPRFEYVTAAILEYLPLMTTGFKLEITSEFSDTLGLGSSAASTIATISVLTRWLKQTEDKHALLNHALNVLKKVQKTGSGSDMVASLWGGTLCFSPHTISVEPLQTLAPIKVIYLGYKTPTKEVIKFVDDRYERYPAIYNPIFEAMGQAATSAKEFIKKSQWSQFGELFFVHQKLQAALGVSSSKIDELISRCDQLSNVYGTKISGSGMGDCVIILGNPSDSDLQKLQLTKTHPEARILNVALNSAGVRYE